jgi:hypothetical protein
LIRCLRATGSRIQLRALEVVVSIDRRWLFPSVALVAFVVGLEVANTAAAWVPKSGDAATWFGAVGAFLAFGATIWVATDQARQKNLEARNLAVLASARIVPALVDFLAVAALSERVFPIATQNKVLANFDLQLLRLHLCTQYHCISQGAYASCCD